MNDHKEMKKIRSVIQDYADGTFKCDIEKLKSVFHSAAVMNGYLGKNLIVATPTVFIEDISSSPSMEKQNTPYHAEVESITVEGNIASVMLSETGFKGTGNLVNHFHLIKIGDDWKIIAKLFTTIDV